ncbi:MAG TPA: HAD-IC family P-type ATPase, partial [Pseudolysinimonas sp.]|nr:HAD-IC family P-type ATPase [Pseudolysinimonas sp.]
NIQILITDKTGTLTAGTIALESAIAPDGSSDAGLVALAASTAGEALGAGTTDALDAALLAVAGHRPATIAVRGFDHERRMSSALVDTADGRVLVCKGAPESILARCTEVPPAAAAVAQTQLERGARLIAVATRPAPGATSIADADETGLALRGFLVFTDPARPEARAALDRLDGLGVRVIVATGDHPAVAAEVAGSLGLRIGTPLAGGAIDALDDAELARTALAAGIVARVSPEQKERLVRVLRAGHTTVGFLGDGVNDALALHAADVGISVDTATDVAKDAADVVLLEKSLDVIADGVTEGRRIFANTLKYVFMAASGNFGNMISAAAASAFLSFLPMLPGQILLGNLLYDASQLTISTDRVDAATLAAPARWDIGAVRRFMLVFGPLSSVFDLATFALLLGVLQADATTFRTGWFVESLASQALVVLVIRTRMFPFFRSRPSLPLLISLLLVIAVAVALPFTPLGAVLGFAPPAPGLLLALAGVVVSYLVIADVAKRLFFRSETERPVPKPHVRRLRRAMSGFSA